MFESHGAGRQRSAEGQDPARPVVPVAVVGLELEAAVEDSAGTALTGRIANKPEMALERRHEGQTVEKELLAVETWTGTVNHTAAKAVLDQHRMGIAQSYWAHHSHEPLHTHVGWGLRHT